MKRNYSLILLGSLVVGFFINNTIVQTFAFAMPTIAATSNTTGDSGGNTTVNNGTSSTVQTGDSTSTSTVINCVNTTVIGDGSNPCLSQSVTNTPAPQPTVTPTPGSNNGGGSSGGGSGSSNGGSSGGSGGSSGSTGNSSGPTQAVLGEMAATGTFEDTIMNIFAIIGIGLMSGSLLLKKSLYS